MLDGSFLWDQPTDEPDEELSPDEAMVVALEQRRHADRCQVEWLVHLGGIDAGEAFRGDGHTSAMSFVMHRSGIGPNQARIEVSTARALVVLPLLRKAGLEGRVSVGALHILAGAYHRYPEDFADVEAAMVEAAQSLGCLDLRGAVEYWYQAVAAPRDQELRELDHRRRRSFSLAESFDGMTFASGWLTSEVAALVGSALDSIVTESIPNSPNSSDDVRTAAQRRHDALGDLA